MMLTVLGEGAENASARRFVGSWYLVSYEVRLASGQVVRPFGDHPLGCSMYQEGGHMSTQLMNPAIAPFASADPLKATKDEHDRGWRNYIGYWGTFSVDANARVVTHQVEGGWFPNWVGQKQMRAFRFDRDRLTLEADSPAWHVTVVWRKVN